MLLKVGKNLHEGPHYLKRELMPHKGLGNLESELSRRSRVNAKRR